MSLFFVSNALNLSEHTDFAAYITWLPGRSFYQPRVDRSLRPLRIGNLIDEGADCAERPGPVWVAIEGVVVDNMPVVHVRCDTAPVVRDILRCDDHLLCVAGLCELASAPIMLGQNCRRHLEPTPIRGTTLLRKVESRSAICGV